MSYNLFICRTPFQVVTAIVLKIYNFEHDDADILLTNSFKEYKEIGEKCRDTGVFTGVKYIDIKHFEESPVEFAKGAFSPGYLLKKGCLDLKIQYTRIFTNSLCGDVENAIYYYMPQAKVILFDEGYSTYTSQFLQPLNHFSKAHLLVRKLSKLLLHRKYIDETVEDIYLYDSELCINEMPYKVHPIWDKKSERSDEILSVVCDIFGVNQVIGEYSSSYIYFEECFANDFDENGDIELINLIAEIVGKDNLMIKLHPRDNANRFKKMGFKTNKTLSVPTEVLVIALRGMDMTFITYSSGSVLNYKFLFDADIKTIALYKLENTHFIDFSDEKMKWFNQFEECYGTNFHVPRDITELKNELKELRKMLS